MRSARVLIFPASEARRVPLFAAANGHSTAAGIFGGLFDCRKEHIRQKWRMDGGGRMRSECKGATCGPRSGPQAAAEGASPTHTRKSHRNRKGGALAGLAGGGLESA